MDWFKHGVLLALWVPLLAHASNGFFHTGYSPVSSGMGGGGAAYPADAFIMVNNPAGLVRLESRNDVGFKLFSPWTVVEVAGNNQGTSRHWFPGLNAAINRPVGDDLAVGLALYGNGGIGNKFHDNVFDLAVGGGVPTGLPDTRELSLQMFNMLLVPSIAWAWNDRHAVGASLLLAYQRIEVRGLGNFQCFTPTAAGDPGCATGAPAVRSDHLTNEGKDHAVGIGLRVGWLGEVAPGLRVGVGASTKIVMSRFDRYKELLPNRGSFDLPAVFVAGIDYEVSPVWRVTVDWQRTAYETSRAFSNPGPVITPLGPGLPQGADLLGGDKGFGFGWEDQDIFKLGVEHRRGHWVWRAGYNYGKSPVPQDQFAFGPLHNSIMEHNLTFGFTRSRPGGAAVTVAFGYGFQTNQKAATPLGPVELEHTEYVLDLAYSW